MRQAIYTLICCFITLTAIQVQSTEEPKHNSKEPCTNPCRNQGDPANPPITINISPTQTLSSGATEKHENKNDKSSWEKWTSIGTLILAFFTFALAGTALWQRFDTKKSSEKQLRAYVHIYPGLLWEQNERTAEMFEARPMMKNNGQTPAYNVVYTGITKILPAVVPGNFDFSLAQHPFPSKGTLGPAQDLTLYPATERLYSRDELQAILTTRGIALHTYGSATYDDAFGKHWKTEFNYVFIFGGKGLPIWILHNQHNHAK